MCWTWGTSMVSLLRGHICDSHRTWNTVVSRYPQSTYGNDVENPKKKTLSPAKNPQQIQFLNQFATHEGLDQDSIHTNQWNITVLGALSVFTWIQKKTYPLDHQIRPSTLEQTLKAIRKKSFWAKKVFQVSTAYLPNSIKPLPSKCFRHTFRQLKVWLRDWTNLFFVSSLQDTDILSFGFTKLRNTSSGHQLAWIPWGQRVDGIDGIDS